jgi:hypothetical protein
MNPSDAGWGKSSEALHHRAPGALLPDSDRPNPFSGDCPPRKWLRSLGRWAALFLIGMALGSGLLSSLRAGDAAPSEAQVKAAFLLNFPKYIEWPTNAFAETNSPIVVAVLGADGVADEFATMSEGRTIEGRPVRLVRVTAPELSRDCHILFIGGQNRKLADSLSKLRGLNVLIVGESDGFLDAGGMINLARHDRRIVLEVNVDSIRAAGLKVSSKLLAVATLKGGKK